jgi:GNAT superfamily N-acetyltransferase
LKVRQALPDDAQAMAELLNRLIADQDGTALTEPVSALQEADYIQELQKDGSCLLAEECGVLLGFQSVERFSLDVGEIGTFVRRGSRGQGVGRALLVATQEWAAAQTLSVLLAEVAAHNMRGQQAYRAWGFGDAQPDHLDPLAPVGQPDKVKLMLKLR